MIHFNRNDFYPAKDGGVYLRYEDIDHLTEEIILDYDKTLLCYPKAIEYQIGGK